MLTLYIMECVHGGHVGGAKQLATANTLYKWNGDWFGWNKINEEAFSRWFTQRVKFWTVLTWVECIQAPPGRRGFAPIWMTQNFFFWVIRLENASILLDICCYVIRSVKNYAISLTLQRFSPTRALQGVFANGQMYLWWMSIICFYDNSITLAVNLAPSEIMTKSCADKILCISNRQQSMADSELLLEKYQNKSLAKVLFSESSVASQMQPKHLSDTQCKLVLTKVNFGSKSV